MSAPPSLTEKLANVQHMPSLIAATVASDKPTDLYLVRDIIKMSYESIQTRVFLQKYFTNLLLSSRNVYVKIKVLKIIVRLLEEGHPDFHKNLQKTPEAFKDSARIRSSDAALAADCGRIRDLANKLLDMIYEDPPEHRQCPYGAVASKDTSNSVFGGEASSKGGGALGGRIQGFGTSKTSQQPSSVSDQISNVVGTLFGTSVPKPKKNQVYDEKYATMEYIPQSSSVGRMGGGSGYHTNQGSTHLYPSNVGAEHVKGRPGGGWSDKDGTIDNETPPTNQNSHDTPVTISDSEQEMRLVDKITTPGGVRVAPPKEDLRKFLLRCKTLDCLAIVEFLRLKLLSDSPQIVTKALFVVESLIRSDVPDILSYLDIILDQLTVLSTSSQNTTIKAKSIKLLHQLSAVESLSVRNTEPKVTDAKTSELLEMDEATNEQLTEYSSLFSGLTLTNSNTMTAKPRPLQATKPVKPVSSSSALLEGLTLNDTPTSLVPASQPQVGGVGATDLLDFGTSGNDSFDPLLTADVVHQDKSHDPLGGLVSLDDSVQSTTPISSNPLEPMLMSTGSLLGMGGAFTQTTHPISQATTGPNPPGLLGQGMSNPPGLLGLGMSNPPGGYQYSQQQHPVMYNQVLNRPVQLMPQTETTDPDSDAAGFGFLSKSSGKAGAFDFIQEEMKAANNKS